MLKRAPAFFDAAGIAVAQHFATSDDGTQDPVLRRRRPADDGPTLLTGYGGFEVSLTPAYSGMIGRGWLARGGTYVVANIRGGGEYGPTWHQAVHAGAAGSACTRTSPPSRKDLVARGITTPARLGIQGGSATAAC